MSNLIFKKNFYKYLHNGEYNVALLKDHTYVTEPDYGMVQDIKVNKNKEYLIGPIVDRLADFEAIGMEPDQIREIIDICVEKGLIYEKLRFEKQ